MASLSKLVWIVPPLGAGILRRRANNGGAAGISACMVAVIHHVNEHIGICAIAVAGSYTGPGRNPMIIADALIACGGIVSDPAPLGYRLSSMFLVVRGGCAGGRCNDGMGGHFSISGFSRQGRRSHANSQRDTEDGDGVMD